MASTVTVTGEIGPARAVTALVLTGVTSFGIDTASQILTVVQGSITKQFDISAATTITITVSSGSYTVEIA